MLRAFLLSVALAACSAGGPGGRDGPTGATAGNTSGPPVVTNTTDDPANTAPNTTGPPAITLEPWHQVSPWVGTVITVSWEAPAGSTSFVEYGRDGVLDRSTPPVDGELPVQLLLGLAAGATWSYRAVSVEGGTRHESEVVDVDVASLPADHPVFLLRTADAARSELAGGYVVIALVSVEGSWLVILDDAGDVVWTRTAPPDLTIADPQPSLDQGSLLHLYVDRNRMDDVGSVERLGWDGAPVQSTFVTMLHHAFIEQPDQAHFAWLSHEIDSWDPGIGPVDVLSDVLLEAPEGSVDTTDDVEIFSYFESQELYIPCDHMLQPKQRYGHLELYEWTHANSLMYEPSTDSYLIGSRLHDSVVKVDGAGGGLIWQMGGLRNEFTMLDAGGWWDHHHQSEAWPGGFVLFDNGFHRDPPIPRALEYRYDEKARTIEVVWEYVEPQGRPGPFLGDVRKLPGGNYLVNWPQLGLINEITPTGDVVWEIETAVENTLGRMRFLPDLYDPPAPW